MSSDPKKRKVRTDFRKNRQVRTRQHDLTREFQGDPQADDKLARGERVSGKGDLTRRRTVVAGSVDADTGQILRDVDPALCLAGRVLSVQGLHSTVQTDDGRLFRCVTRRILKTLSTDLRHVVVAGDRVLIRPEQGDEAFIERVEPRKTVLSRTSKRRQHVIVANVDQLVIVSSAAEPYLKPNLIDRMLLCAEKGHIRPLVCINKIDLINPADLQPLVGVYGQMGYDTLLVSATTGFNIPRLREKLAGRASVVAGQSGVGKSSLLNAIDAGLALRVGQVSSENQKGKHTTTSAQLIPLPTGGYVVDTPGIRQFQLWDVTPPEVAGFFRDLRPFVNLCRFPDCTHTHEADCAVKDAVADGHLDSRRYESYCHLFADDQAD